MTFLYNLSASKKATNLTINSDLLTQAKEYKINLSATLESALAEVLKAKKEELWKEENSEAIACYNNLIEEHGLFSDESRTF